MTFYPAREVAQGAGRFVKLRTLPLSLRTLPLSCRVAVRLRYLERPCVDE